MFSKPKFKPFLNPLKQASESIFQILISQLIADSNEPRKPVHKVTGGE